MNPFALVVGQSKAVELLSQAVAQNRVAPAYLFVGSHGVGRCLTARCFIELLFTKDLRENASSAPGVSSRFAIIQTKLQKGNHPDVLWIQPTYQHQGQLLTPAQAAEKGLKRKAPPVIRLEQIREVTQFLGRPPLEAPRNIVVLEQVETMAEAAANALLKTLEEPGKATLILIAPSPDAILSTLVSRCQKIPFYRLDQTAMAQVLQQTENQQIMKHPTVLSLAAGSPGEAIASYQQLQAIPPELLTALSKLPNNYRSALELAKQIDQALDTQAQLWLVDYLQQHYWQELHQPSMIQQLEKAKKALLCYAQPRLVWECTFLSMCQASMKF
ncbi:MAG: DNA polymerase III subunit delta' [Nostocaceae cyanobacterium]|nr:DNA polymerase III subunit delta' [Nostocaceae cyanobacterium]